MKPTTRARRRLFTVLTSATLLTLTAPGTALADQSPAGCTSNNLAVDISRSLLVAHPGDTVDFTVTVTNGGAGACDVLNATINFVAPDGTVSNLATGAAFPADGSGDATYGPLPYVVDEADEQLIGGIPSIVAAVTGTGDLADVPIPGVFSVANIFKNITVRIIHPGMDLVKTADLTTVAPGTLVTYTYVLTNTGDVPLSAISVTDDLCAPLVFGGGDTDGNSILDLTETWTYTCQATIDVTTTNTATATGTDETGTPTTVITTETVTASPPTAPAITLVVDKSSDADGDAVFSDGETFGGASGDIPFRVVITNTSTVPVVLTAIQDTFGATTMDVCVSLVGTTLAPGASITCDFTLTGYGPESGTIQDNTVAVTAEEEGNPDNAGTGSDASSVEFTTTTSTNTAPAGELPATGTTTGTVGLTGLALLLAGGLLVRAARRRPVVND